MIRYFVVIAAFLYMFATTVTAQQFFGMGSNAAVGVTIARNSIVPIEGSRRSFGAWVDATYAMSVECSPPRGCYAASQRAYLHVLCPVRAVGVVQKISMDLNGSVVAVSEVEASPRYFRPRDNSMEDHALILLCGEQRRSREDRD